MANQKKQQPADLSVELERARTLKPLLSGETDDLNMAIEGAEGAFTGLGLGMTGAVQIQATEDGWSKTLAFAKDDASKWRLLLNTYDPQGKLKDSIPLVTAPRAVRILAVEFFPKLLQVLNHNAQNEVKRVQEAKMAAIVFATKLLADPTDYGPPPPGDEDAPF